MFEKVGSREKGNIFQCGSNCNRIKRFKVQIAALVCDLNYNFSVVIAMGMVQQQKRLYFLELISFKWKKFLKLM